METAKIEDFHHLNQLVLISLGTDRGSFWADVNFGSDLWLIRQSRKVDDATATAVKQEILRCLNWLKEDGLIFDLEVVAKISGKNRIDYRVCVFQSENNSFVVEGAVNVV